MFEETVEWLSEQLPLRCDNGWFEDEVWIAFHDEPTWAAWKAFRREERHCVLEVCAMVSEQTHDLQLVQNALMRAWRQFCHRNFQLHSEHHYSDAVVLRFVITGGRGKHRYWFPGRFVVGGEHYQRLLRSKRRARGRGGKAPFDIDWREVSASAAQPDVIDLEIRQRDHDDDVLILARVLDSVDIIVRHQNSLDDETTRQAVLHNLTSIDWRLSSLQNRSITLPAVRDLRGFRNATTEPTLEEIKEAIRAVTTELPKLTDEYSRQYLSWRDLEGCGAL